MIEYQGIKKVMDLFDKALRFHRGEETSRVDDVLKHLDELSESHEGNSDTKVGLPLSSHHKFLICAWVGSIDELQKVLQEPQPLKYLQAARRLIINTRGPNSLACKLVDEAFRKAWCSEDKERSEKLQDIADALTCGEFIECLVESIHEDDKKEQDTLTHKLLNFMGTEGVSSEDFKKAVLELFRIPEDEKTSP